MGRAQVTVSHLEPKLGHNVLTSGKVPEVKVKNLGHVPEGKSNKNLGLIPEGKGTKPRANSRGKPANLGQSLEVKYKSSGKAPRTKSKLGQSPEDKVKARANARAASTHVSLDSTPGSKLGLVQRETYCPYVMSI